MQKITQKSVNGDDSHAQKLFVNIVDTLTKSVYVASSCYVCNIRVYRAQAAVGRHIGRFQAVQGATAEVGFGRYKGERVNVVVQCVMWLKQANRM